MPVVHTHLQPPVISFKHYLDRETDFLGDTSYEMSLQPTKTAIALANLPPEAHERVSAAAARDVRDCDGGITAIYFGQQGYLFNKWQGQALFRDECQGDKDNNRPLSHDCEAALQESARAPPFGRRELGSRSGYHKIRDPLYIPTHGDDDPSLPSQARAKERLLSNASGRSYFIALAAMAFGYLASLVLPPYMLASFARKSFARLRSRPKKRHKAGQSHHDEYPARSQIDSGALPHDASPFDTLSSQSEGDPDFFGRPSEPLDFLHASFDALGSIESGIVHTGASRPPPGVELPRHDITNTGTTMAREAAAKRRNAANQSAEDTYTRPEWQSMQSPSLTNGRQQEDVVDLEEQCIALGEEMSAKNRRHDPDWFDRDISRKELETLPIGSSGVHFAEDAGESVSEQQGQAEDSISLPEPKLAVPSSGHLSSETVSTGHDYTDFNIAGFVSVGDTYSVQKRNPRVL
ncbi:MAG: hypothetical protein Q9159_005847 [Coniocarpon cinnabarinum]